MTHSADDPQPPQGQPVPPPPPPAPAYPPPPPQPYSSYAAPTASPKNGLGTTALILGILGVLSSWLVIGFLLGLIAVILGFKGRGRVKRGEATNGGAAMAGIILGFLTILASIAFAVFYAFVGAFFWEKGGRDYYDCVKDAGNDQAQIQECADQFQKDLEENLSITITPTP